jgi:hypothetical protein
MTPSHRRQIRFSVLAFLRGFIEGLGLVTALALWLYVVGAV